LLLPSNPQKQLSGIMQKSEIQSIPILAKWGIRLTQVAPRGCG
jgi:hypothetical protein